MSQVKQCEIPFKELSKSLVEKFPLAKPDSANPIKPTDLPQQNAVVVDQNHPHHMLDKNAAIAKKVAMESAIIANMFAREKKALSLDDNYIHRQLHVESLFFDSRRTKNVLTKDLSLRLLKNRMLDGRQQNLETICADRIPARRWIIAEKANMQIGKTLFPPGTVAYARRHPWFIDVDKPITNENPQHYGNWETVCRGSEDGPIVYKHRVNPHFNQLGEYVMKDVQNSNQTMKTLIKVSNNDQLKIKQLINLLIKSACEGYPITSTDVKKINDKLANMKLATARLNRVVHRCFIKEPCRRMMPRDAHFELPLSTAMMRAFVLIEHGHLQIEQAFDDSSVYGILADDGIGEESGDKQKGKKEDAISFCFEKMKAKVVAINKMYEEKILLNENVVEEIAATNQSLHSELKACYGGDSDTDGEDYA